MLLIAVPVLVGALLRDTSLDMPLGAVGDPAHAYMPSANIAGLILGTAIFAMFLMLTLYMQQVLGYSPLRAGAALIDLVPVDGKLGRVGGAAPGPEGRNMDHFCLRVEPFDEVAIRSQLAKYGYAAGPLAQRYGAEGDGPSIYVTDPEGNVVELKGPPGD